MADRDKNKEKVKKVWGSISKRAKLTLPVGRVRRLLRAGTYAPRTGIGAAIFLTAVLEYLVSELLDLASEIAIKFKKVRILPRHILLAIRNDCEFDEMLGSVIISNGGVLPHIEPELLPHKTKQNKSHNDTTIHISSQEY